MTDKEIIAKINKILTKVHEHFNNADSFWQDKFDENAPEKYKQDRHGLRNWLLDIYRQQTGNKHINMFSFDAEEIIKLKIPSQVVGCSGRADLFAKYANEMDLDVNIVAMVDIAEKDKDMPNGHQIIAVKFPDGSQQLIDPGRGRETYEKAVINGKCNVGEKISYNRRDDRTDYEITAILTPDTHAKIDSQEKLTKIYKNPQIKPETREILTAVNTIVNELQNPKTGLNSLATNIMKSLNEKELVQLNEDIKIKIKRKETKTLQYIKMILQRFVIEKIQWNEDDKNKDKKSPEQFKKDIPEETKKYLATIKDLSESDLLEIIDKHNNVREALNGKPEIFMKYGISTSCSNAATAFIHEFGKRYKDQKEKLSFLDTTRWDSLLDGGVGHVVPCIQIGDDDEGDWIMIEPLHETIDVGISTKIIPNSDFKRDKPLEHLMAHHKGEPYMITAISKEPCTNHEQFLTDISRVPLDRAQTFINQIFEQGDITEEQYQQQQRKFERERRIQSLRLATEELGKQVQHGPYVSMDELKKAQAQQAYLGID